MQTAIHELLLGTRTAVAIWLSLLAITTLAFIALTAPALRQHLRSAREARRQLHFHRVHLAARAAELNRYAEELSVAAKRAAVTASRRRAEWETAHRMGEAVWRAYDRASRRAWRVMAAAAYRLPDHDVTEAELAWRARYARQASAEAHRRGELSSRRYADALLHRHGWSRETRQADVETMLRCAASDRLLSAYRTAAALERAAWHDAEVAAAASASLNAEARLAARESALARAALATHGERMRTPRRQRAPEPAWSPAASRQRVAV